MAPPSVSRFQALRETHRVIENPINVLADHAARLGETYYYHFGGVKKVLVSSEPAVVRHILKDNYANYRKSEFQMERIGHFLGPALLTSHGDYWLGQRRLMQKGFRADKLAAMTAGMQASLDQKLADLDAASQAGPVNVYDQMVRTTFAMFARSLFSTSMTDDEIGLISDAIRDIQGFVLRQIVQPHLRPRRQSLGQAGPAAGADRRRRLAVHATDRAERRGDLRSRFTRRPC